MERRALETEGDIKACCGDDLKLLHCQFLTVSSAGMLFAATVVVGLLLSPGGKSVLTASFVLDSVGITALLLLPVIGT